MSKFVIAEIDRTVCGGDCASFSVAMRRIETYIIKNIDKTFPADKFKDWYNGDSDKPFVWNKNRYHWS